MSADCPLFVVDAFADEPFSGNPAAVCLLTAPTDEARMQRIAMEMSLSETAFVHPRADGDFALRWFTPEAEVALCGHATLATAHVLYETARLAPDAVARFHTKSGVLEASREGARITLDFPATPPTVGVAPSGLLAALGVAVDAPIAIARSRFDVLVELADEAAVRAVTPDFGALRAVDARGVMVAAVAHGTTKGEVNVAPDVAPDVERGARGSNGVDFVSRFFAPRVGVDEDPVTGSAHCALTPYFAAKLGRATLVGRQLSRRGGIVSCALRGERVALSGRAITVVRGELCV